MDVAIDALVTSVLDQIGDDWNADDHEDRRLDFKETPETTDAPNVGPTQRKAFRKLLAETAACLANTAGGAIIVGVKNTAPDRATALAGVDSVRYPANTIIRSIYDATEPPLAVDVELRSVSGVDLLILWVPRDGRLYASPKGSYKHRVADSCVPMGAADIRDHSVAAGHYDWSAQPSPMAYEDLSLAALERAESRLREVGDTERANLLASDPEAFLSATGLLTDVGELTRAGALLFGKRELLDAHFPQHGVLLQSRASAGGEARILLHPNRDRLPVSQLVDRVLELIASLSDSQSIRIGAAQFELVDYPVDALRELIANAFLHREWEVPGNIEIIHTPDELEISSPGGLLPGLTVTSLLHGVSLPRNRTLATAAAQLRLAEGAGLGFDRTWRSLAQIGKPPPLIESDERFTATIVGGLGDRVFARFVATLPLRFHEDLDALLVMGRLREVRTVSADSIHELLQRSVDRTERILRSMSDNGILDPSRASRTKAHPVYGLADSAKAGMRTALHYRTQTVDEDEIKLLRHLERYRRISNADVRNYIDCDVYTARNRLAALRKKQWIAIAPDGPSKGPNVEYVPGERFETALASSSRTDHGS